MGQEPNHVRNINENGLNRLFAYDSTSKLFLFFWSRDSVFQKGFPFWFCFLFLSALLTQVFI